MTAGLRHFLDLDQIDPGDLRAIIDRAKAIKQARTGMPKGAPDPAPALSGHMLAALFERESTRTRVSFDVGMRQLGGQSLVLQGEEIQLGRRESIADTARVLSRYADIIVLRTLSHNHLTALAEHADIPVINGLTDLSHPCQLMADVLTIEEHMGPIAGKAIAWTGDGDNVAASLVHAAVQFGFELRLATPTAFAVRQEALDWAAASGGAVHVTRDPVEAVQGADCVFADTFVSMGDTDRAARLEALAPYCVTEALMSEAKSNAIFLHCLPAHRGEEVDAAVIDGPQSAIWDEAENRLHAQKAILLWCLGK